MPTVWWSCLAQHVALELNGGEGLLRWVAAAANGKCFETLCLDDRRVEVLCWKSLAEKPEACICMQQALSKGHAVALRATVRTVVVGLAHIAMKARHHVPG